MQNGQMKEAVNKKIAYELTVINQQPIGGRPTTESIDEVELNNQKKLLHERRHNNQQNYDDKGHNATTLGKITQQQINNGMLANKNG